MKFIKSIGILTLFALLALSSCRKDKVVEDDVIITPPIPEEFVNGSASGIILNEAEQGLPNVEVNLGTNTTMTDENGYFLFENVDINKKGSLVTAEKDGYFYNAQFVGSRLNKLNFTKIKMIEKIISGSFPAANGGNISTNGGANIQFPSNGIKLEGGGLYAGNVNVYATWLDPTANDLGLRAPGDLRGTNSADEQVQLTTYGMIGVELESDAGESLNLADGQTATIEVPVPSELLADAPATIPLWHFDESSGHWVEEGEATLQGDKYVGTVSHFSFWNYDVPSDYIFADGLITDEGGVGIQNLHVEILVNSNGATGYDWTDEDGVFSGYIPNDENLTLNVYNNCGDEIYSAPIGPFSSDVSIPEFSLVGVSSFITLSGSLECMGNVIDDGYAKIFHGNSYSILTTDASGDFSGTIDACGLPTIDVIGYDLANITQSVPSTHDISGLPVLDLGTISACEDWTEQLTFNIGGETYNEMDPVAYTTANNSLIITMTEDSITIPASFSMIILASTTGFDYNPTQLNIGIDNTFAYCSGCLDVDVDITTFEGLGGLVIGSFEGTVPGQQGQPDQVVSGSFKVLRE